MSINFAAASSSTAPSIRQFHQKQANQLQFSGKSSSRLDRHLREQEQADRSFIAKNAIRAFKLASLGALAWGGYKIFGELKLVKKGYSEFLKTVEASTPKVIKSKSPLQKGLSGVDYGIRTVNYVTGTLLSFNLLRDLASKTRKSGFEGFQTGLRDLFL